MCLGGGSAKQFFSTKTNIHLRNPENKCPGPQNDCPGLKIYPQAFKITAYLGVETPRRSTAKAQRNGTVPGYARSALDIVLCEKMKPIEQLVPECYLGQGDGGTILLKR